jgi:hypothetical protein
VSEFDETAPPAGAIAGGAILGRPGFLLPTSGDLLLSMSVLWDIYTQLRAVFGTWEENWLWNWLLETMRRALKRNKSIKYEAISRSAHG